MKIGFLKSEAQKLLQELVAGRNELEMLHARMDNIYRRITEMGNHGRRLFSKRFIQFHKKTVGSRSIENRANGVTLRGQGPTAALGNQHLVDSTG
ncbi:unnamed protein product [Allacma fusca]|uniref:Uncharacterized protein n=1 Tax=Allacma fusca TaxID=39272 RepID=A0A8J2KIH4_9HEXA|nr:unnamed protein product [Allacma fusca]